MTYLLVDSRDNSNVNMRMMFCRSARLFGMTAKVSCFNIEMGLLEALAQLAQ
jgi:hypothetical protein